MPVGAHLVSYNCFPLLYLFVVPHSREQKFISQKQPVYENGLMAIKGLYLTYRQVSFGLRSTCQFKSESILKPFTNGMYWWA